MTFSILTFTKLVGGMGLPEMRTYYYVSLMDQIKYWLPSSEDKLWANVEREVTLGHDIYALSLASNLLKKIAIPNLLSVKATLLAWKHILSKTKVGGGGTLLHLPKITVKSALRQVNGLYKDIICIRRTCPQVTKQYRQVKLKDVPD